MNQETTKINISSISFNLKRICFSLSLLLFFVFLNSLATNAQEVKEGATPAWVKGNPSAPVTIEVFNDYQCPPCNTFNEELKKIENEFKDKVRFIFRNYPLTNLHPHALAAAQAAEAAGIQGKFFEMVGFLYRKQKKWSISEDAEKLFVSFAQKLGLDAERFKNDMKSKAVAERIALDIERANSLHATGTPEVFLNGEKLGASGNPFESLRSEINVILKQSQ